jgi:hypothetical protein
MRRGQDWTGTARLDLARQCSVGCGEAIAADGSTGNFGSLCCSLWRVDEAMSGGVRLGKAQCGMDRSGEAMVADGSTELRKKFPAALLGEWLWSGALRSGKVWRGKIRFGLSWLIVADGSTGAFGLLCRPLSG